jgi:hypothetical protein
MGFKEASIPAAFMVIAIVGIALGSMNINTYMKLDKKDKDKNTTNNLNFSIFIICFSVLAMGIAGYFTYKAFQAPSAEDAKKMALAALDPTLAKLDTMMENLKTTAPKPANFADPSKLRNLEAAEANLTGKVTAITTEVQAYQQALAARLEEVKAAVKQQAAAQAAAAAATASAAA